MIFHWLRNRYIDSNPDQLVECARFSIKCRILSLLLDWMVLSDDLFVCLIVCSGLLSIAVCHASVKGLEFSGLVSDETPCLGSIEESQTQTPHDQSTALLLSLVIATPLMLHLCESSSSTSLSHLPYGQQKGHFTSHLASLSLFKRTEPDSNLLINQLSIQKSVTHTKSEIKLSIQHFHTPIEIVWSSN